MRLKPVMPSPTEIESQARWTDADWAELRQERPAQGAGDGAPATADAACRGAEGASGGPPPPD